jgi:hypothetical protein
LVARKDFWFGTANPFACTVYDRPSLIRRTAWRTGLVEPFPASVQMRDDSFARMRGGVPALHIRSCQSLGPFDGDTCTAVTLYSGQLVAQSENSVVMTLACVSGWWKVV